MAAIQTFVHEKNVTDDFCRLKISKYRNFLIS